jgi:sulfite reductase alpha subunit-like flavoprotein
MFFGILTRNKVIYVTVSFLFVQFYSEYVTYVNIVRHIFITKESSLANYFVLKVGMPCGTFILKEDSSRPIILIAGGVGLTPMVSMLDYVMAKKVSRMFSQALVT